MNFDRETDPLLYKRSLSSREARDLREAATKWADNRHKDPTTNDDKAFRALDRALLLAARKYAALFSEGRS